MNHSYYIGIDPSIVHTGWAVVKIHDDGISSPSPLNSGVILTDRAEGDGRIGVVFARLFAELWDTCKRHDVDPAADRVLAVIEKPHYEEKRKSKHIFSLVAAAGACVSAVTALAVPYAYVGVSKWKRDLPEFRIRNRVEQIFPQLKDSWKREDEYVAFGLALWGYAKRGTYPVFQPGIDGGGPWKTGSSTRSTQISSLE